MLRFGIAPGFAIIMIIVLIAVIIYTIIAVRKQAARAKNKTRNPALENLKKRYQRGEMSKEDYETKKKQLKS